jgi:hypothetical protein
MRNLNFRCYYTALLHVVIRRVRTVADRFDENPINFWNFCLFWRVSESFPESPDRSRFFRNSDGPKPGSSGQKNGGTYKHCLYVSPYLSSICLKHCNTYSTTCLSYLVCCRIMRAPFGGWVRAAHRVEGLFCISIVLSTVVELPLHGKVQPDHLNRPMRLEKT